MKPCYAKNKKTNLARQGTKHKGEIENESKESSNHCIALCNVN